MGADRSPHVQRTADPQRRREHQEKSDNAATDSPASLLQHAVGNRATARLLSGAEHEFAAVGRAGSLPFRGRLERAFGESLAEVRVRVGAADATASLGAGALTRGQTIVFGQDAPHQEAVAHEVAHVVQNRRSSRQRRAGVSVESSVAEREAAQVGRSVAAGEPVQVQAAPDALVQCGPLDWLKRNFGAKHKAEVKSSPTSVTPLGAGTANQVDKATYDSPIGTSGTSTGFFKPNKLPDLPQGESPETYYTKSDRQLGSMSSRAVGSSNLAKAMGLDVVSEETLAQHGQEKGSVSAEVSKDAVPLKKNLFNKALSDDEGADLAKNDPARVKVKDGKYYEHSGSDYQDVDYSQPQTQKGMFDLQAFDSIVGQDDRHGGNIYVDKKSGKVTGIDNDRAMSAGSLAEVSGDVESDVQSISTPGTTQTSKYRGLPSMMDKQTAKKIKKFDFTRKNLRRVLDDPDQPEEHRLNDEDYKKIKARGRAMQSHVKSLKKTGGIVDTWDSTTYAKARGETTPGGKPDEKIARNYISENAPKLEKQKALAARPPLPTGPKPALLPKPPKRVPPPPLPTGPKPALKKRPVGRLPAFA